MRGAKGHEVFRSWDIVVWPSCSGPQAYWHEVEPGHSLKVGVGRDDGQAALEGRGRNQGVDIANEARAVGSAQLPANVGIPFKDGVSEEIGRDLTEECSQSGAVPGVVGTPLNVFNYLGIGQDAGGYLVAGKPGRYEVNGRVTAVK